MFINTCNVMDQQTALGAYHLLLFNTLCLPLLACSSQNVNMKSAHNIN